MSRALRAVSGPADAVAAAEESVRTEEAALEKVRSEERSALAAYDKNEAMCDDAAKATRARERAERRHATALDGLKAALAARDEAQRTADRAEMQRAIEHVASLPSRVWPEIRKLVELDRHVAVAVDAIADIVVDAIDTHERATALGERLELVHEVQRRVSRPVFSYPALIARIAILRDRRTRGSDLANGWCEAALEPKSTDPTKPAFDAAVAAVAQMEKT